MDIVCVSLPLNVNLESASRWNFKPLGNRFRSVSILRSSWQQHKPKLSNYVIPQVLHSVSAQSSNTEFTQSWIAFL